MEQYHAALTAEIRQFCAQEPLTIDSIFIGGGTPSTYPPHLLLDTFAILSKMTTKSEQCEISLEVNPGTVTPEKVAAWQQAGINRLSIGVQSLNDRVLHDLNRHQAAADVLYVLDLVAGKFKTVSIDLILGLPGISAEEWKALLAQVVQWPIQHLSLYFLTVHESTPLYFGVRRGRVQLPPDESVVSLYEWSVAMLAEHGFEQYEISNFARPGHESFHNSAYWRLVPYKAFGIGACSYDGKRRFANTKNLATYLQKCSKGESPVDYAEELTEQQQLLESVMLGLRQRTGLNVTSIEKYLTNAKKAVLLNELAQLQHAGFIVERGEIITLTPAGLSVENEIIVRIMRAIE